MNGPEVIDVAREAIITIVEISAPLLIVSLVAGMAVSLLQALTQIQELTVIYVPRILAMIITFVIALPFMAYVLSEYMAHMGRLIAAGG